ncbi:MAG: hypothetical protein ABDH49_05170 [Candidatus Hydrothermales bacterium]
MKKIKNKFTKILYTLEKEKIKYIITGGVAVIIYGYLRTTKDVDLILDFKKDNVERFLKIVKKFGFIPRVPFDFKRLIDKKEREKIIEEKGAKVFTFINPYDPFISIDIHLEYDYSKIKRRRIKFKDTYLKVVAFDELIKMKRKAGRPQDIIDVENLLKIYEKD